MILSLIMHSAAELGIKYLQIFNSRLVLASPETATDADYAAIEGVIGHEVSKHFSLHLCFGCQCVMEVSHVLLQIFEFSKSNLVWCELLRSVGAPFCNDLKAKMCLSEVTDIVNGCGVLAGWLVGIAVFSQLDRQPVHWAPHLHMIDFWVSVDCIQCIIPSYLSRL